MEIKCLEQNHQIHYTISVEKLTISATLDLTLLSFLKYKVRFWTSKDQISLDFLSKANWL
jgi:hypothetical protein